MNDPYLTLGISRNASTDEIKKAFRILAHKYHPDKPTGDAKKFSEIKQAYDMVKDRLPSGDPNPFRSTSQNGSAYVNWDNVHTAQVNWEDILRNFGSQMEELFRQQMANDEANRQATRENAHRQGRSYVMVYNPETGKYQIEYV